MTTAIGAYATGTALKTRANISDSTDDTLIGTICDQVNQFIEGVTGRIIAPISGTPVYTYDGTSNSMLYLPLLGDGSPVGGVRSITTLQVAQYTGAAYETLAAGDYFLRGKSGPAAPFDWLMLSDRPVGQFFTFPRGYDTVKITGLFGWAAIPDDITDVALTIAVRAWHAREAGQQDIVGTDEFGRPLISRFVSGRDRDTLRRYTLPGSLA